MEDRGLDERGRPRDVLALNAGQVAQHGHVAADTGVHEGEHLHPRESDRDVGGAERQDDKEPTPIASGHGDRNGGHEDVGEEEAERQGPSSRPAGEHDHGEPRGDGVALQDGRHAE